MLAIRSGILPSALLNEDPIFIDAMLDLLREEQEEAEEAKKRRK